MTTGDMVDKTRIKKWDVLFSSVHRWSYHSTTITERLHINYWTQSSSSIC